MVSGRDVLRLAVPRVGRVADVDDQLVPYRLLASGGEVKPVTDYLREMVGRGSRVPGQVRRRAPPV